MKKMTIKQFADINLYCNKNVETVINKIVNESSNAILVSLFEDSMFLFDTTNKNFYSANYKINTKELIIENFEKYTLTRNKEVFNTNIKDFFNDKKNINEVVSSYSNIFSEAEKLLTESINSKLTEKSSEYTVFNKINEARKKVDISFIYENETFKTIYQSLKNKPSQSIYSFDFKNKTSVSLVEEEEEQKPLIITSKQKTKNLWKDEKFRTSVNEASEENTEKKLVEVFNKYKNLSTLNDSETKELFSKSVIMENNSSISVSINKLMKVYKSAIIKDLKNSILDEYEISEEVGSVSGSPEDLGTAFTQPEAKQQNTGRDNPDEMKAPSNEDWDDLIAALKAISDKADEEAKEMLNKLIEKFEEMKEKDVIDVELLREALKYVLGMGEKEEEKSPIEPNAKEEGDEEMTA